MAGQNLTNFDAMLKEFYPKDVILDLVKQRAPFYFEFQKSKRISADGRQVIGRESSARGERCADRASARVRGGHGSGFLSVLVSGALVAPWRRWS